MTDSINNSLDLEEETMVIEIKSLEELTEEDLVEVIRLNSFIKEEAGEILLKRSEAGIDIDIISLISVAKFCSEKLKEKVWEKLLKEKNLSKESFGFIAREIPYLRERAKEKLLKKYPEKKRKGY